MKPNSQRESFRRRLLTVTGLLIIAGLLVAGCVVNSVYPFYTAKDLTFDPALLGTWGDPEKTNESKATWTFEKISPQTYKLTIRDSGETNEFDTHLFTLDGQKFLDSLPQARVGYHTPSHFLLRVKRITPTLELQLLDYEWLGKLIERDSKAIRYIIIPKEAGKADDGGQLTLTADTAELQQFLLKHRDNTNAWSEPVVMKKR